MKLAITLFLGASIATSSPKQEYIHFMGDFTKTTQLSFNFSITQNANGMSKTSTGYYKRSDNAFILKNEEYLVISSKEITMTLFETDKIILLDEPKAANNFFVFNDKQMDNVITKVIEVAREGENIKQWNVTGDQWGGNALIKADVQKNVPLRIALYYNNVNTATDKPMLDIKFLNISKAQIDKNQFDVSPYLQKKGNEWVTTKKYSNYELINNLD